ncbi:MAG: ABC transporter ATP-binding protein/permease [Dehalococcoidia bacterium]|nr:ABC transporter ATP-binding protein/permease [Dehalococcoidia bacterium]
MLSVKDLSIKYGERVIFENANLEFKRGTVSVIQGKSGSGKSSLLNVLGLMQTASNIEYSFDGTLVSSLNDTQRADFRLHNIGFVFQQSNLIQELTAKENLIIPMSITSQDNNIFDKADELIKYVGLEAVKNSYPGSLSGGEEQRLAIARALANNADIILADEPTASLDADNSKIVLELFSRLAHDMNKIVILVSHSEIVSGYADVIFEIKDKSITATKSIDIKTETPVPASTSTINKKRNVFRFVRYYTKKRGGDRTLNRVFVAVTAIVAAAAILSTNFGTNFAAEQRRILETVADRSILVVNNTLNYSGVDGQIDYEEALAIPPAAIAQISSLENISASYPWYTFLSDGVDLEQKTSFASIIISSGKTIIVDKRYSNSFAGSLLTPREKFTVCPYYDEEYASILSALEYQSSSDVQNGLILSGSLANTLSGGNPQDLIGKTIVVSCFVPTKLSDGVVVDREGAQSKVNLMLYKLVTIESTVAGILPVSYSPWNFSRTAESDLIFIHYDKMVSVLGQNKDSHLEANQYELGPSALVVYAESYSDITGLISKLENISTSFNVATYKADIHAMLKHNSGIRSTMVTISFVFIGVIVVLFSLLYYLKNRSRKKEFGILKAIGFTKSNILALTSTETMILALPAFLISLILAVAFMFLGNKTNIFAASSSGDLFSITIFSALVGLVICVVVVSIASILSIYTAIKVDPIDAIQKINK